MAIPRKPKPSMPAPEALAPELSGAQEAIAAALEPVPPPVPALAAPAAPAELARDASPSPVDLQALIKQNTDTALAEARSAQERVRLAAEQGLEQTRAAYEKMKAAAEEATSTLETSYAAAARGWSELHQKTLEAMKAHADAHFEHVKAVISARSVPEILDLQTAHVKARLAATSEQLRDFASVAQKVAADAGEPIKAILGKRFAA